MRGGWGGKRSVPDPDKGAPAALSVSRRGRKHRFGLRVVAGLAITALAAGTLVAHAVVQAKLRARLIRVDPDTVAEDVRLRDVAVGVGEPAYQRHCATCHGVRMQGDRRRGAPNLADQDWLYGEGRVAQIERTILHGIRSGDPKAWNHAEMPAFAQPIPSGRYEVTPLTPAEIRDVVEYLLVNAGKPGDKAAAARGASVFANKGRCSACHANDGKGDAAIGAPNLVDDIWLTGDGSREALFDIVARGSSGICPAWIGQLDFGTIRALAVFVYLASHDRLPQVASSDDTRSKPAK